MHKLLKDFSYAALLSLDDGLSLGSGFLLKHNGKIYVITAKHVLCDEQNDVRFKRLMLTIQQSQRPAEEARLLEIDIPQANVRLSKIADVAAIELGISLSEDTEAMKVAQPGKVNPTLLERIDMAIFSEIVTGKDVYMVGFPTSLIFEQIRPFDVSNPLLRRGIVAGINGGDQTFIVDCSVYHGNSGAPILQLDDDSNLRVAGVVSRYIPFVVEWRNNRERSVAHAEYQNSGYAVCSAIDSVMELVESSN